MAESTGSGLWQVLTPWSSPDAMNQWFSRTAWWTGAQPFKVPSFKTQQQMLRELLEAVAGRFLGRELTLDVRGRQVTFTLGQVRVETEEDAPFNPLLWWTELPGAREMVRWTRSLAGDPRDEPRPPTVERVHVDTSGLSIDEHAVGDVAATVEGLHVELGPVTSELVTGPVDLDVTTSRAVALEWVRGALPDWDLRLRDEGVVAARNHRWPVTFLGHPEVLDARSVRVAIVGVEVFGRGAHLPRRFVRHRTFDVPSPSAELEITALHMDADVVRVGLRHGGVRQPVRPEHVRGAIREGITSFGAKVFGAT